MGAISRKNNLGRNLNKMSKLFPEDYNFFPRTWMFPGDYHEFKIRYGGKEPGANTFIVKPEANCQGRGIYMT